MNAERINPDDWTRFGEGRNGQSYYHRTDDTVVLKLNPVSWTEEKSLDEFNMSKAVHGLGVRCPEVLRFVTDGERFGYISRRIKGKKSFSRMIADEPSRIPELAATFAARARELHATPCDTAAFQSLLAHRMALIDNCKAMPDDVRARLESISKEFDPTACTCLHGDFHPGNLISGEGGEYWIDLGGFSYGDPLLDISTLYMTAYYTPAGALKSIFHMGRRPFCKFVDEVIRCYYGEALDDRLMQKIKDAAIFKAGISICSTPGSAFIFVPLIRGQKFRFAMIMLLVRLLWPILSRGKV